SPRHADDGTGGPSTVPGRGLARGDPGHVSGALRLGCHCNSGDGGAHGEDGGSAMRAAPVRPSPVRPESTDSQAIPRGLFDFLAGALLAVVVTCRFLTPTDAAAVGETLWIAQLSLLALVLCAFALVRQGEFRLTLHWVDGAVFLFCLGHIAGALVV